MKVSVAGAEAQRIELLHGALHRPGMVPQAGNILGAHRRRGQRGSVALEDRQDLHRGLPLFEPDIGDLWTRVVAIRDPAFGLQAADSLADRHLAHIQIARQRVDHQALARLIDGGFDAFADQPIGQLVLVGGRLVAASAAGRWSPGRSHMMPTGQASALGRRPTRRDTTRRRSSLFVAWTSAASCCVGGRQPAESRTTRRASGR